jgi:hypothetical protein
VQEDSTACSYVVHQGNVTVSASGAATPVVTASSVTYSTGGYGSPFRALPLASGNVLVSVSASTSGMLVFGPVTGGGLQLSCFNYVRPQCVQDAVYLLRTMYALHHVPLGFRTDHVIVANIWPSQRTSSAVRT